MSEFIYSREELKRIIEDDNIISYGEQYTNIRKSKISEDLLKQIVLTTDKCRDNLNERIYWIMNDIFDYNFICINCGKRYIPKYYGLKSNYRGSEYCGNKCLTSSNQRLERSIESYLIKTNNKYRFPWENPEVIEKRKQNFLDNIGVFHPMLLDKTKQKIKEVNLERYGVENVMHSSEFIDKTINKGVKYFSLPSGKKIYYQGYEDVAIKALLENYIEEDIITSRKEIPEIWYESQGKKKRYYPDIWICKNNLIIEVKSIWTYNKDLEKNLLKRDAALKLGYKFQFWICSDKEILQVL